MKQVGSVKAFLAAALVILASVPATPGCTMTRAILENQDARIDSLEAANADLAVTLAAYQDSIAFYDFIDSGEFVQEMRFRDSEINRLQYILAICRDGGSPIAVELVDDLFEPASARLTQHGGSRLDELADSVREHADVGLINIEGHSDSTRPTGNLAERYPSNWELSAARASAVARYFVEKHEMDESLFRIVSYGAAHPVASNGTPQGRRLNRRIRITYVPGSDR